MGPEIDDNQFCYITTVGRRTGRPHVIEIWFAAGTRPGAEAAAQSTLYVLAGGRRRSDWVRNIMANPVVEVRVSDLVTPATGRVVEPGTAEDLAARRLVLGKYQAPGAHDLEGWGRTALVVALDLP